MSSNVKDEWYTLSCTSLGPSTLPREQKREYQGRESNFIGDIQGSSPGRRTFCNKPSFLQSEVDGSQPKQLIIQHDRRNAPDRTLMVDDIPGTRYAITDRMMKTNRHVNPLVPDYSLPSYVHTSYPESKLLRDTLDISDIDGTKPKPLRKFDTVKDLLNTSDIEGTHPGWKPVYKRRTEVRNIMNIEDIAVNKSRYLDRTNRVTDVLDPKYVVNGIVLQDGRGNKPKPLKKYIPDNHLLATSDIPGAYPGWKNVERTEVRNLCNTLDIEGAQADTIKHSIVTLRAEKESPLNPTYQLLDDGSPLPPLNKPLVPGTLVKMPTLKPKLDPKVTSMTTHNKGDNTNGSLSHNHSADSLALDFNKLSLAGSHAVDFGSTSNNNLGSSNSNINFNSSFGSSRPSPVITGRNSGAPSNRSARESKARQADIEAVRGLI
jgi:hypothetical protein